MIRIITRLLCALKRAVEALEAAGSVKSSKTVEKLAPLRSLVREPNRDSKAWFAEEHLHIRVASGEGNLFRASSITLTKQEAESLFEYLGTQFVSEPQQEEVQQPVMVVASTTPPKVIEQVTSSPSLAKEIVAVLARLERVTAKHQVADQPDLFQGGAQ